MSYVISKNVLHFSICACHPGYGAHAKIKGPPLRSDLLLLGFHARAAEALGNVRKCSRRGGGALTMYNEQCTKCNVFYIFY